MSSKKISELTALSSLIGTELIPIAKAGNNYSITPNVINNYISNNSVFTSVKVTLSPTEMLAADPITGFVKRLTVNPPFGYYQTLQSWEIKMIFNSIIYDVAFIYISPLSSPSPTSGNYQQGSMLTGINQSTDCFQMGLVTSVNASTNIIANEGLGIYIDPGVISQGNSIITIYATYKTIAV